MFFGHAVSLTVAAVKSVSYTFKTGMGHLHIVTLVLPIEINNQIKYIFVTVFFHKMVTLQLKIAQWVRVLMKNL